MAGGLFALLDDVALIARSAASSVDDVAALAGKTSMKSVGVVVDDAAVTPQFVDGVKPQRELPMIWRITKGSLINKLIIILPIALILSWIAPWAHKGAPYHRLAIVVLEQNEARKFDVSKLSTIERNGFNLRNFVRSQKLQPLTATLFRTKWDETMAEVMERAGLKEDCSINIMYSALQNRPYLCTSDFCKKPLAG